MSDMIDSSLLMRYASNIFSVNSIYDDEDRMENKGLIVNIKNWFKLIPRFEYHIQENDEEMIEITYNFDIYSENKTLQQQARSFIISLLSTDATLMLTQNELVEQSKLNKRVIRRAIQELIDTNKLVAIGQTQDRKYKIK